MTSQTSEYALRAIVCLGDSSGRPLTTRVIAEQTKVPPDYLSKVLQGLSRAGLVESQRGLGGGFTLSRPLDTLTVLDVINAVDPLKRITQCPLGLAAHRHQLCALHQRLDDGIALVESLYGSTTIAELLALSGSDPLLCEQSGPLCQQIVNPGVLPRKSSA
jgi:Rrf2 family protein